MSGRRRRLIWGALVWACSPLLLSSLHAGEVRESYDSSGRLVRRQTIDDEKRIVDELVVTYNDKGQKIKKTRTVLDADKNEETTYSYDAQGRLIREELKRGGKLSAISYNYDADSERVALEIRSENGAVTGSTRTMYDARGRESVVEQVTPDGTVSSTTTYRYDLSGNLVGEETLDNKGVRTALRTAEFARPSVPIRVGLDGGLNFDSSTGYRQASLGFEIIRKPTAEAFGLDPLEVRVNGAYELARTLDSKENDYQLIDASNHLRLGFGVDYNYLFPKTTPFLFLSLDRDEVNNLQADLQLAPLGIKYDLVPRDVWLVDASFAPVWNYRAILEETTFEEDGSCSGTLDPEDPSICEQEKSTSKLRGSFRFRVGYGNDHFSLRNTLEFLPNLRPEDQSLGWALSNDSILRDSLVFEARLTERLTFRQELRYTSDPTLADQASDCGDGASNNPSSLCDGKIYSSMTSLSLAFQVNR